MQLATTPSFDFLAARRAFRQRGMYLRRSPNGQIHLYLRPGTSVDAAVEGLTELITNLNNPDYASNAQK